MPNMLERVFMIEEPGMPCSLFNEKEIIFSEKWILNGKEIIKRFLCTLAGDFGFENILFFSPFFFLFFSWAVSFRNSI